MEAYQGALEHGVRIPLGRTTVLTTGSIGRQLARRQQTVASGLCTIAVAAFLPVSCHQTEPEEALPLARFATSQVPLSEYGSLALANETTACVIESYDFRIYCTDDNGSVIGYFGREGEGPGEFQLPWPIIRGPNQTVGVVDVSVGRMTVFEPTGKIVSTVRLPSLFSADAPFNMTVAGSYSGYVSGVGQQYRQAELDVSSGEIIWERIYPDDVAAPGCAKSGNSEGQGTGFPTPAAGMMFLSCRGQLVFFSDRDTDATTVVRTPTYVEVLPTQEEVNRFVAGLTAIGGGLPIPESRVDRYRTTPKPWLLHYPFPIFDNNHSVWILTARDRNDFSYLDIFSGTEYAGTVRVRDRAMGFDVLGSTLAVLVDRPVGPGDLDGSPDRGIDWYDISGLEFGLSRDQVTPVVPAPPSSPWK